MKSSSLEDRLRSLAAFLPRIQAPGFTVGEWVQPPSPEPGVYAMPYYRYSNTVTSFEMMAYLDGWMLGFDWGSWKNTEEASKLRDDPEAIPRATTEQLAKLLTVAIRQDRFCEGALASAFESGLVTRIVKRAAALLAEASKRKR